MKYHDLYIEAIKARIIQLASYIMQDENLSAESFFEGAQKYSKQIDEHINELIELGLIKDNNK